MLKVFISITLVVTIVYSQGTTSSPGITEKSIRCNLCVGSTISDCATAKKASMAVQECHTIIIPRRHRHHPHHHSDHHHQGPEATTTVNDVINNSVEDTDRPEFDDDLESDNNATLSPWNRRRLVLDPMCAYLETQAFNGSTANVVRGCGYMPADKDFCTFIQKKNKNVIECKTCNTNECN